MDLYKYMEQKKIKSNDNEPLALRMRPETLDEIVGQSHIIGSDKLLFRMIKSDHLSSIIFYGPPGSGKTTIAGVIAKSTKSNFMKLNATGAGKKDMEEIILEAKDSLAMYGKQTILFIDEIHRFNKSQQDYLLPFVEDGTIILIGATTENPYFEVNKALLSRSRIFELKEIGTNDIKKLLKRAITDKEKGLGYLNISIDDDAINFLADVAGGDARAALNAIEIGVLSAEKSTNEGIHITLKIVQECIQKHVISYDKDGNDHYNITSAFIKSMRGSDPDASIYYLAKMLEAGEDIKFIARRIMICASEDVGCADPMALIIATNASLAVERIGMPEARIILAQAVIHVARAPKSNSAIKAIDLAIDAVRNEKQCTVPAHLCDAHYNGAQSLGKGIGYKYAHDYPNHYVKQQYLPDELIGAIFYKPSLNGFEKDIQC